MSRRNIITAIPPSENRELILCIIANIEHYKACYWLSKILSCRFVINVNYLTNEAKSKQSANIEYFIWKSVSKGKKILLIPNTQTFETEIQVGSNSIYANNPLPTISKTLIIPSLKHIDYLLRFDGLGQDEIFNITEKIRLSKKFQLVKVEDLSKIKESDLIYYID